MTNGPFINNGESRQGNGWPRRDDRSSGESISRLAWQNSAQFCVCTRAYSAARCALKGMYVTRSGVSRTNFRLLKQPPCGKYVSSTRASPWEVQFVSFPRLGVITAHVISCPRPAMLSARNSRGERQLSWSVWQNVPCGESWYRLAACAPCLSRMHSSSSCAGPGLWTCRADWRQQLRSPWL
jgi:hypothetical protein